MTKYLKLPGEITAFEHRFLSRLNRLALIFFYLHIPVLVAVAWVAGTGTVSALLMSFIVLTGPTIAYRMLTNPRSVSVVHGITAMLMGGLLVHFGQGPVQIEMHFYFFALLAMLCMFANPSVNLAAAVTVALHHLLVWWFLPSSIFNYNAQWWVVLVHAAFVVLETVAACYISREFFDNVIGLEKIVEARTATIRQHQRDMRLILNNLEEGLVTIDLDGQIAGETSRAMREWFGSPGTSQTLAAWIARTDSYFAEWLELGLESVRDGMLPREITLTQLPARLAHEGKTYSVRYQTMSNSDEGPELQNPGARMMERRSAPRPKPAAGQAVSEKLLVIFSDITDWLNQEAAKRRQSDLLEVFQHLMRDRSGFLEFLAEADDLVETLLSGKYAGLEHLKRLLHTLKGNCAIFGIRSVSGICHDLESALGEDGASPDEINLAALQNAWREIRSDATKLLGKNQDHNIEINDGEYTAVLGALRSSVNATTLARMLESWRLEPTGKRLSRVEQQLMNIAERLGKSNVEVLIEPNGLRFESERFAPFWSAFIHVLRNTVDHGIEAGEERRRAGKPEKSTIKVSTAIENGRFVVSVADDGPGIDWERLRAKAAQLGIAESAYAKPADLLCLPGLSSKDAVTELSGRGIGMSALAEACRPLGGTIEVESELGVGTRIRFAFPKDASVYEGHAALLESENITLAPH